MYMYTHIRALFQLFFPLCVFFSFPFTDWIILHVSMLVLDIGFFLYVVPAAHKGSVSWDHCREDLAKLSSVNGKAHVHFAGFGSRPLI